MKIIDFVKTLRGFDKDFFTTSDLEKILNLPKSSLKVTLSRLTKDGVLTRLMRGVYQSSLSNVDIAKVANQLYYPSYLSFEAALSFYSILSQVPYTQTFATVKKSKRLVIRGVEAEFTQLKEDLFFGYTIKMGMSIAEPEKALLDQIYMVTKGKRRIDIEELDLKNIDKKIFLDYSTRFPAYMKKLVDEVVRYIGTTPVTLETKDRIVYPK